MSPEARTNSHAADSGDEAPASAYNVNVSLRGKTFLAPACKIQGREIVSLGRWLRIASVRDEDWLELEPIVDLSEFASALRHCGVGADIFEFAGPIDGVPRSDCAFEMDNIAVIKTEDFQAWWEGLPQEARKNTRRAAKRGVEIRPAELDDEFVAGIKEIYDETPIRQGRKFWHYGKDVDTIRQENSSYSDRAEFIGAYYSGRLVGFMKFVYVGNVARIMQILCLNAHQDKRPIIALIVKAAEICSKKRIKYLVYGRFIYGKKDSSVTEFKRRLGFVKLEFPRYYMPITLRGEICLRLGLHKGVVNLIPSPLLESLLQFRAWWLGRRLQEPKISAGN